MTSAEEFYYPPWKRLLFQCLVSLPVCLACLSCVFLLMLGCFQLQVGPQPPSPCQTAAPPALTPSLSPQEFVLSIRELPRILRFLPKIILAVIVTACDEVYKKIAYWLNDMGAWWPGGCPRVLRQGLGAGTPPAKPPSSSLQRIIACRVPMRNTSSSKWSW